MANPACVIESEFGEELAGIEGQLDRILNSKMFRGAPTLGSFLKFIVERTLQGKTGDISEYSIAIQVFGRGDGFDPASDTIVRTQAYRLRAKLQQYYARPDADDLVLIEVPKGHYVPIFRARHLDVVAAPAGPVPVPATDTGSHWMRNAAGLVAVALLCGITWMLGAISGPRTSAFVLARKPVPSPVSAFWKSFLGDDRQPVVSYANGQFLGTSRGTLVPFQSGPAGDRGTLFTGSIGGSSPGALMDLQQGAGPLYFQDDYTGIGEVMAAVSLTKALADRSERVDVKRSSLISTFDLQAHNVIFLGGPGGNNRLLGELLPTGRFVRSARSGKWDVQIRDTAPEPGEPEVYRVERDANGGVIKTDYATVSVLPGMAPGRRILILGGLLTSGTAAAAAAVTEPESLLQLANKLGVRDANKPGNWPGCFESFWRVKLSRGLDVVHIQLVAANAFKTSAKTNGAEGFGMVCGGQ